MSSGHDAQCRRQSKDRPSPLVHVEPLRRAFASRRRRCGATALYNGSAVSLRRNELSDEERSNMKNCGHGLTVATLLDAADVEVVLLLEQL
jgi:hypothetical protein